MTWVPLPTLQQHLRDVAAPNPPAIDPRPARARNKSRINPGAPFRHVLACSHRSRSAAWRYVWSKAGPSGDSQRHFPRQTRGFSTLWPPFPPPPPQQPARPPSAGWAGPGRAAPRRGDGPQPGAAPRSPPAATMSCALLLGLRGPRLLGAAARPPPWSRRRSAGCEPPAGAAVRIGCASGFWGDTAAAGRRRRGGRRRGDPAGRPGGGGGRWGTEAWRGRRAGGGCGCC